MADSSFTEFTLGKYRAVALLGKGGFGTVYRAIDTTLEREVALKLLHPQLLTDGSFVMRFRNEAKAIAALRHPNVVGVYELGEVEGRLLIAMEYMPSGTLKDRLAQRGHLPFDEALAITQQVAAGLEAAHAEGLVHRDLKPANILFDKQGHAVVGDFGLARAMQASSASSSSTGGVGTPFYKAPELWRGKPPASPATDVYSLACIVYEMLTGRVLFGGDTPDEVLTKHLIDGPDFNTDWPPADAPIGLTEVLQCGLARNQEERYATAKALAEALNELTTTTKRETVPAIESTASVTPLTKNRTAAQTQWGVILGIVGVMGVVLVIALLASLNVFAPTLIATTTPGPTVTLEPTITPMRVSSTPTPAPTLGVGSKQVSDKDGMTLLYVPAGEFKMGAADSDTHATAEEKPQHAVYLDVFWIDQTEVTNTMFKKFIDATRYKTDAEKQGSGYVFDATTKSWSDTKGTDWQHPRGPGSNLNGLDNHPVVQVSWNDAKAYCQWVGGDLPTEAQWEKAARWDEANQQSRLYPWGDRAVAGNLLNFADRNLNVDWADKTIDDGYQFTAPVGHYPDGASPYGAFDMAGNVWEWVADWYGSYPSSPSRNPAGPSSGDTRVVRGGSWDNVATIVRASFRGRYLPDYRVVSFGFRCAR